MPRVDRNTSRTLPTNSRLESRPRAFMMLLRNVIFASTVRWLRRRFSALTFAVPAVCQNTAM